MLPAPVYVQAYKGTYKTITVNIKDSLIRRMKNSKNSNWSTQGLYQLYIQNRMHQIAKVSLFTYSLFQQRQNYNQGNRFVLVCTNAGSAPASKPCRLPYIYKSPSSNSPSSFSSRGTLMSKLLPLPHLWIQDHLLKTLWTEMRRQAQFKQHPPKKYSTTSNITPYLLLPFVINIYIWIRFDLMFIIIMAMCR
jgi:hypothetical protein